MIKNSRKAFLAFLYDSCMLLRFLARIGREMDYFRAIFIFVCKVGIGSTSSRFNTIFALVYNGGIL